jgi:prevent-host-death family protein
MPDIVNVHEAKTHLSRLIERVERGEQVVIGRAGRPVARLVPYAEERTSPRPFGLAKGQSWAAADAWEPDQEMIDAFWTDIARPFDDP